MSLKNWTVRAKLTLTFGALTSLLILVAWAAAVELRNAETRFDNFVHGNYARLLLSYEARTAIDKRAIAARDLINATSTQAREPIHAEIIKAHDSAKSSLSKLAEMASSPDVTEEARTKIDKIQKAEAQYAPVALAIVGLALNDQREAAITKMNLECRPLLAALNDVVQDYRNYTVDRADLFVKQAFDEYVRTRNLLMAGCLVAFVTAVVAALVITRSVTRALGAEPAELGEIAQRVASGDLSAVVGGDDAPRGSVLASLGMMQQSLAHIVGKVRSSSDNIATGASQIASGNADLSQRTEEQASNLEQTAASMEQLSGTVKNSAEIARRADQFASQAAEAAREGGQKVGQAVEAMHDISQSSQKIADIIGVIDGIAFQTNILALNAAVEAARAGDQGRGFAVVAGEVRTLAKRCSEAAQEIKGLIDASVERVDAGTRQVDAAGISMQEIVSQAQRVSQMIGELTNAAIEQSQGIGQVGDAVQQLDHVTQQNAALVEETAAAAESLRNQADQMTQAMRFFKIDSAGSLVGLSTPPTAARTSPRPAAPQIPQTSAFRLEPAPRATTAPADTEEWASF